jgi:transcriptional regulator with XRE-family HTH domain
MSKEWVSEDPTKKDTIKSFLCEYLKMVKKRSGLTYKDFKDECKITDKQLSCIFTKRGEGVSIEVIEMLLEKLEIMYKIEIYEREW